MAGESKLVLIILLIVAVLFFIGFVVMVFVYSNQLAKLVSPSECQTVIGSYIVTPGVTGQVNQCQGAPCIFTAVTLTDAINQCTANSANCSQFLWTEDTAQVMFVGLPLTSGDPNVNAYTRPTGVT